MHSLEIIKALNDIAYKKEMAAREAKKILNQHVTEKRDDKGNSKHIYI